MKTLFDFDHPPADPIEIVREWLHEAGASELSNPGAMTLATVDPDGRPSARLVLLKGLDARGAVFYTNRLSRKGRALEAHPEAALVMYWDALDRQVVFEGRVSHVDDVESDEYFASRPRGSQVGAWASRQSEVAESRAALDAAWVEVEERYDGGPVPRPPHWGGYVVAPDRITLWHGRANRLHDRIAYTRTDDGWVSQRLHP